MKSKTRPTLLLKTLLTAETLHVAVSETKFITVRLSNRSVGKHHYDAPRKLPKYLEESFVYLFPLSWDYRLYPVHLYQASSALGATVHRHSLWLFHTNVQTVKKQQRISRLLVPPHLGQRDVFPFRGLYVHVSIYLNRRTKCSKSNTIQDNELGLNVQ